MVEKIDLPKAKFNSSKRGKRYHPGRANVLEVSPSPSPIPELIGVQDYTGRKY
jgi:hypothetical protein